MQENIETKVAKTILQQPEEITVGGTVYKVAPPSTATLILVSEAAARMPQIKLDSERIVDEVISVAKDCRPIGDFVAIMILGAKNLVETKKETLTLKKKRYFGLFTTKQEVETEVVIDRKTELSKKLLEDLEPRELHNLAAMLLQKMQVADFFGLTTFLTEINLLRQTRKVENETTVSGQ